jgi:quinol monooxygenase YgiN
VNGKPEPTENVILAVEFAIIPGRFEHFKTLAAEMIEATQHNEPGTLNYEWAISDDRQVCHVYERFWDSGAVMTHMERFNANFAARFGETVKLAGGTRGSNPLTSRYHVVIS